MDFFMKLHGFRESGQHPAKGRALIDWQRPAVLGPVRSRLGRHRLRCRSDDPGSLLGQWHSLSVAMNSSSPDGGADFMLFCGQAMIERSPDRTTILPVSPDARSAGLDAALLSEVNRQLQERGLNSLPGGGGSRPSGEARRQIEVVAEDRAEGEAPEISVSERLSADPDARWLKKRAVPVRVKGSCAQPTGRASWNRVLARPANEGEAPHFPAMVSTAQREGRSPTRGCQAPPTALPDRGGDPVGDHVPGFPVEASLVPASPWFNRLGRGGDGFVEDLRHPEATVRGGAVPVHGTAGRGGRAGQVDGLTCSRRPTGSSWSRPEGRSLSGTCPMRPSGPETINFGAKIASERRGATDRRPTGARRAPNGETQEKHSAFATVFRSMSPNGGYWHGQAVCR